jgi:bifunctional non-homologous end joining protein LigD
VPTPEESGSKLEQIKMETKNWKKAKVDIDLVFQKLTASGFIALQDAGYTQSDGFSDCSEAYHKHPESSSVIGFCFYTRQDLERAKNTSILMLGYWGAPDGEDKATEKVGRLIIEAFDQANFEVQWSGKSSDRPSVLLHTYSNLKNRK